MPYNKLEDLPATIKKLPVPAQKLFLESFNKSYKDNDEATAFQIAWSVVKKKFKKTGDAWVARSEDFAVEEIYKFEVGFPEEEIVIRTENGEDYFELPVASLLPHSDGFQNTPEVLNQLMEQFNNGEFIGDFDHELFDGLRAKGFTIHDIKNMMKGKSGIAKSIKAYMKDNVLWLMGKVDKRYSNLVKRSKGLSIEAIMKVDKENKRFTGANLLGFSFGLSKNPADLGTRIAG